jgi:hypothetical protein
MLTRAGCDLYGLLNLPPPKPTTKKHRLAA